jgi:hypothetical protein
MLRSAVLALIAANVLSAASAFKIGSMVVHQFEDGPVLPLSYEFLPGETAYFSCRLAGFSAEKGEETQHVKLSWRMEVSDPAGVLLQKAETGLIEDKLLAEDKEWAPKFLATFVVPSFALSGDYRVSVQARDELAGQDAAAEMVFHVKGHAMEPSLKPGSTLAVRNFLFLRDEADTFGMRNAVYRPGDTVWARFDVTGYKFEANNRFSVTYSLAVESTESKELFAQPEAGAESRESFYPQPYVPGTLTLSLDKNVPPAMYTLVVTVKDTLGGQTSEVRQPFKVE